MEGAGMRASIGLGVLSSLLIAGSLLLLACSGDDDGNGAASSGGAAVGDVDVLGIWGSEELTKFEGMVDPWQKQNSSEVNFTGTRDITAVLATRVEGGNPPDIAIPAEIGLFKRFAAEGKLTPLSRCEGLEQKVKAEYPKDFVDLATVNGTLYGFFMKADTKATIWYNPKVFNEKGVKPLTEDSTFSDLMALSQKLKDAGVTPWSMGVEAAAASGWPGGDWIQQILLNEAGPGVYSGLVEGQIRFSDPRVKDAWTKFGELVQTQGFVLGGPTAINATNFQQSTLPVFASPPRAAMVYLGGFASGFIKDQYSNAKPETDYDFFSFPGGAVTGGANIVYAFNSDPGTCSLLSYLAGADAQKRWVQAGGFTSVNKNVDLDAYPDAVAKKQARQLLDAESFRLDLDDAIGGATQQAMFAAVTQFISDPSRLDTLLSNLDATRAQGGGR
jgi:alpha-glucoside transport system substrate-binding protein